MLTAIAKNYPIGVATNVVEIFFSVASLIIDDTIDIVDVDDVSLNVPELPDYDTEDVGLVGLNKNDK